MIGQDPTDLVTIRFETDNPGPWFIHCHIDWHLGGMRSPRLSRILVFLTLYHTSWLRGRAGRRSWRRSSC